MWGGIRCTYVAPLPDQGSFTEFRVLNSMNGYPSNLNDIISTGRKLEQRSTYYLMIQANSLETNLQVPAHLISMHDHR